MYTQLQCFFHWGLVTAILFKEQAQWIDGGKDERLMENKGGSEKGYNKARLLGGRTSWEGLQ